MLNYFNHRNSFLHGIMFHHFHDNAKHKKQIRYSRYSDFNENTIKEYMKMKKNIIDNFDLKNLKDYFFLEKDNFFTQ
tara:strand:- start:2083 stop:2313 length:231 start_codon:yes stop_codon:yes gene_type:complete